MPGNFLFYYAIGELDIEAGVDTQHGIWEPDTTGHIRTVSEKDELRDVPCKPRFGPGPRRNTLATAVLFALLTPISLAAGTVQAQENLIDFEQFTGPGAVRVADPPLTVDEATFSGGGIATNVARLRSHNDTTVYGTWHRCNGCATAITVDF